MTRLVLSTLAAVSLLAAAGCTTTEKRAGTGAVVGAGTGALVAAATGSSGSGVATGALIGGAAVMALLNGEFKFKKPTMELAFWAILGGFFMGIGSRLALGCNVGAFFVRTAMGDMSGWLFGFGMIGGAFIGVKIFNWYTAKKMEKELAAFEF